ncbi:MAG: TspO/MBR family protein [Bacillota bacterium]|nr:TspO/MBR family protein [Bacillota bacterium]
MNKKTLILCLLIPLLIGGLSGFLTMDSTILYQDLNRPPFSPPNWLFPVVWTILYLLMGLSSYLIVQSYSSNKEKALILYGFQLLVNFIWPLFFFNLQNYFLALLILIILIISVIYMLYTFKEINIKAFYLNIPYLLWLIFAFYLNFMIFLNN